MSLLLPEIGSIGLFPGHNWLRPAGADTSLTLADTVADTTGTLLPSLASLLDEHADALPKGGRVSVHVSDKAAAMAALPWQAALRQNDELHAFALAHFDRLGINVDENWLVQVDYRHYGGMGLAFAFERNWMQQLIELLDSRDLHLYRLGPISASTYRRQRLPKKRDCTLVLQSEPDRMTALVFDSSGMLCMDVEPVTTSVAASGTRLLRRTGLRFDGISMVKHWTAQPSKADLDSGFIAQCLPAATLQIMHQDCWSN